MFSVNRIKQQLIFWGILIGENKVKIGLEYGLTTILPSKSCIPNNTLVLAYFTRPNWNQLSSNFFCLHTHIFPDINTFHFFYYFGGTLLYFSCTFYILKLIITRRILLFISKYNMNGIYFKYTQELESQRSMKL